MRVSRHPALRAWWMRSRLVAQTAPTIQLALHVEDEPDIHRAGRTFLLPACCTHCLPSPCGRLSRPRTTTEAPPLIATVASRLGHPAKGSRSEVLRFRRIPLACFRTGLYPVRILALGHHSSIQTLSRNSPVPSWKKGTSAPPAMWPHLSLPNCRGVLLSTGASTIRSLSLSMTGSLAGRIEAPEVASSPASPSLLILGFAAGTRRRRIGCLSRRAVPRRVRGLPPRKESVSLRRLSQPPS